MIPILMYHQVADIPRKLDPLGLAIPPTQFEQQMSYLASNGYICITLLEAMQYFRKCERAPTKSFVLTFDDGYQDFHSNACPILEKFGFSATVFLVVDRLGSLSNWWGQEGDCSGLILSRAEARELARRGHILGSHTLSHPFLNLLDDQSAFEEIHNSKIVLQNELDMQIDFFSETNPHIEELVESAGYIAACAGDLGPWSIFHLWRVPCLRDDTALSYALKVRGWYDKRTALRESSPGRFLRGRVRILKRRLNLYNPRRQAVLHHDLEGESERGS
jgi:peptidoglycan/xylan/chitin deacetylase (PgdA/CDA1 family)